MNTEIEQFDFAKKGIAEISGKLENFIVTDKPSRDKLYALCLEASGYKKRIDDKRLELIRPITQRKKELKSEYDNDIAPLDKLKKEIEEYAKNQLMAPLESMIAIKKTGIIDFDRKEAEEKARRQKELELEKQRQEEAERKAREDAERKEREERERLEAEARKKEEELNGVARAKARREAEEAQRLSDEKSRLERERLEREAQERRKALEEEERQLAEKNKGRIKKTFSLNIVDLESIPREFLVIRPDMTKINDAIKSGIVKIPGIEISWSEELMYK